MAEQEKAGEQVVESAVAEEQVQNPTEASVTGEAVASEFEELTDEQAEGVFAADGFLEQLAVAQQEVATLKDQMMRVQAEAQNIKRRAEMDVDKARKFALEKFANELLPVVDSLELAIAACNKEDEQVKPLLEGVELTLNMFVTSLAKFNLEVVNPEGEAFDPNLHQAMSMVEVPNAAPNTVVAVMQKGYTLHGRLVRPAMVMVAKG